MKKPKIPWSWTATKDSAARLIAEGALTTTEIARRLGVSRGTLYQWKRHQEFKDGIAKHLQEIRAALNQSSLLACHERAEWRMQLLDRVAKIVAQISDKELLNLKRNPISAINLLLRLHNSVEQFVQKHQTLHEEYEQSDLPDLENISPGVGEKIMEILDAAGEIGNPKRPTSRANVSTVRREDNQLPTS